MEDDDSSRDNKIMFEIERLEANIELDSRSGYTFFSIMIPLSAAILGGFLAFFDEISEDNLPFIFVVVSLASISPLILSYGIHARFNWATDKRLERIKNLEEQLHIHNRRLFHTPPKEDTRFSRIIKKWNDNVKVRYYFILYIIINITAWFVLAYGLFYA